MSPPSVKLPKTTESKLRTPINNNLIKLLRPRVYITDSSTFKALVQQLTGNGNSQDTPTATIPPRDHHRHQAMHKGVGMKTSIDNSSSSSLLSRSTLSSPLPSPDQHELHNPTHQGFYDNQMMADPHDVNKTMERISSSSLLDISAGDDHHLSTEGLVQRLTGNRNFQDTPTATIPPGHHHHQAMHKGLGMKTSIDNSSSSSLLSRSTLSSPLSSPDQHELHSPTHQGHYDNQMMADPHDVNKTIERISSSSFLDISTGDDHHTTEDCFGDLSACWKYQHDDMNNHASWFVDLDHVEPSSSTLSPNPLENNSCIASSFKQDVISPFDYELSGFLM